MGVSQFETKTLERGRQEGVAQGLKTGLLEALELGLELRFGKSALGQMDELSRIESVETLKRVKDALTTVASPAELRSIYAS
ncbi:MAG: hypothetical protein NT029_12170 [Armatimonadetes bacterium]|nr:hypothetical protein [Armatimonadota bacterium]